MQHIIIVGGLVALIIILSRRKKRKQRSTTRTVTTKTVYTIGTKTGPARTDPRIAEKQQRERQKADRLNMIRSQSAADLVHLQQRRRDLLKAYDMIPAADTEKNIKKRIQYDNAIRNTDKQIAAARYNMNRTI